MKREEKYYPEANEWMWDYCTFLGNFEDSEGQKFDLGILEDNGFGEWSLAVVYGNEPGSYISGGSKLYTNSNQEFVIETLKRARKLKLI